MLDYKPSTSSYKTLHEVVQKARQKLNQDAWDYIIGGTETETTLQRNRQALDLLAFRPRVLRDVSNRDASTEFMGKKLRLPVCLAPVGSLELFTSGAASDSARAASQFGVAHMLSSVCKPGIEQLAQDAPEALRLFQLYVHGDSSWVDEIAERVVSAGYKGLCLTVDSAVYSRRERDISKNNARRLSVPGREFQEKLTWKDIDRLKSKLTIPISLKGIATAEDARMALDHGVDMIYVSNHGGRQLDHCLGSMSCLPEITKVVAKKIPVVVDGGFNRGSDIVKAMIAGADMVGLGRIQCLGLGADGQQGLVRVLELLELEVKLCMGMLGIENWSQVESSMMQLAPLVGSPHVLSAFPLLQLNPDTFY